MAVGEQEVEHEPVRALAVLQHVPASRVSVVVNILVTLISAFTKRVTVSQALKCQSPLSIHRTCYMLLAVLHCLHLLNIFHLSVKREPL